MAERAQEKAKKGAALIVEGRLTSRDYEDKASGAKRTVFEVMANRIQFLSTAQEFKSASSPSGGESTAPASDAADIEEVPF